MAIEIKKKVIDDIVAELKKDNADLTAFGFLIGSEEGENITVEGVVVPAQERNITYAKVEPTARAMAYEQILDMGKNIVGIVCYVPFDDKSLFLSAKFKQAYASLPIPKKIGLVVNQNGKYRKIE
jgi:hypothetical protein